MTIPGNLGELQLAIMQVLWQRGEAAASEVHRALWDERQLAPTTISKGTNREGRPDGVGCSLQ